MHRSPRPRLQNLDALWQGEVSNRILFEKSLDPKYFLHTSSLIVVNVGNFTCKSWCTNHVTRIRFWMLYVNSQVMLMGPHCGPPVSVISSEGATTVAAGEIQGPILRQIQRKVELLPGVAYAYFWAAIFPIKHPIKLREEIRLWTVCFLVINSCYKIWNSIWVWTV